MITNGAIAERASPYAIAPPSVDRRLAEAFPMGWYLAEHPTGLSDARRGSRQISGQIYRATFEAMNKDKKNLEIIRRYRRLRARACEHLRANGYTPTSARIDAEIQRHWYRISEGVYRHFLKNSLRRREIRSPLLR